MWKFSKIMFMVAVSPIEALPALVWYFMFVLPLKIARFALRALWWLSVRIGFAVHRLVAGKPQREKRLVRRRHRHA
jgi:hypothetical protein